MKGARHIFGPHPRGGEGGRVDPLVDVVERSDALVVEMELPGVDAGSLSVYLEGGRLVVEGCKGGGRPPARARFLLLERQFGAFAKEVDLHRSVNPGRARASLAHGVLTVLLPLLHDKRAARQAIAVTVDAPEGPEGPKRKGEVEP
jgi:HSP20 family molecular chaperone IbpA